MDLWDIVKMLFRRWYVTVPLLALTAVAVFYSGQRVDPTYTASAGGVFLAPVATTPVEERTPNPWLQAGISTTAAAVQGSVVNPTAKQTFAAAGLSTDFSVQMDSRSVLFSVFASAPTADDAKATLNQVVEAMRNDLRGKQQQYGVPDSEQIAIQMFTDTSIVSTRDGLSRVLLVVGGVGVVLTVAVAVAVDVVLARRRARRDARAVQADEAEFQRAAS